MSTVGELKVQKSTFIWNISDFSRKCKATGDWISSSQFQMTISAKQKHQWHLDLFPFGETEDAKDYLSMYLYLEPSGKEINEKYYYEMSILDDSGNSVNVCKCTSIDQFKIDNSSWGWQKFIKRKELFHKKDSLLVKDILKISCFIHVNPCGNTHLNNVTESLVYHYQPDKSIDSLVHQYHDLFLSEEFSDVTIKVDDKEIKTHKNILCAKSKVFSAMLKHDMKESNTHTITIADIEYEVVIEFLLFLYCRKQISQKNAKSLIAVADKYDIDELKSTCEKMLWDHIDIDGACDIFCLADLHNCKSLRNNVMNFIITNAKEVIKTKAFEELSKNQPILLKEIFCTSVENRIETNI